MGRPPPLPVNRVRAELRDHPRWHLQEDLDRQPHVAALRREYLFPSFRHAIDFMSDVSGIIDRIDHHPTWSNTYNRLSVELQTWDGDRGVRNTVTDLDIELAKILDERAPHFFEATRPDVGTAPRTAIKPTLGPSSLEVAISGRHPTKIRTVAWSPDGKQIAAAAGHEIRLWTVDGIQTQQLTLQEEANEKPLRVLSLAFSPDGKRLAAGTSEGRVDVFDLSKKPPRCESIGWPQGVSVLALCWAPNQQALVGVGEENYIRLWFQSSAEASWQLLALTRPDRAAVSYRSVLWSVDGSILAGASDGRIDRFVTSPEGFSPRATSCYAPFEVRYGHSHWVTGLACNSSGSQVLSIGIDRTLRIWDAKKGTLGGTAGLLGIQRDLPEIPTSVGYANKERLIAIGSAWGTISLFDAAKGTGLGSLRLEGKFAPSDVGIAVSPCEARAALPGPEQDRVWFIPLAAPPKSETERRPSRVFVSYVKADAEFRDAFLKAVVMLKREKRISVFTDAEVIPGEEFAARIRHEMSQADIFVLLVSADFLASESIWDVELATALKRHELGTARVLPILLRPTPFIGESTLNKLQWLPTGREPVTTWESQDAAWVNIAEGLRSALDIMAFDAPKDKD